MEICLPVQTQVYPGPGISRLYRGCPPPADVFVLHAPVEVQGPNQPQPPAPVNKMSKEMFQIHLFT